MPHKRTSRSSRHSMRDAAQRTRTLLKWGSLNTSAKILLWFAAVVKRKGYWKKKKVCSRLVIFTRDASFIFPLVYLVSYFLKGTLDCVLIFLFCLYERFCFFFFFFIRWQLFDLGSSSSSVSATSRAHSEFSFALGDFTRHAELVCAQPEHTGRLSWRGVWL